MLFCHPKNSTRVGIYKLKKTFCLRLTGGISRLKKRVRAGALLRGCATSFPALPGMTMMGSHYIPSKS